jgi:hypothetical protein
MYYLQARAAQATHDEIIHASAAGLDVAAYSYGRTANLSHGELLAAYCALTERLSTRRANRHLIDYAERRRTGATITQALGLTAR